MLARLILCSAIAILAPYACDRGATLPDGGATREASATQKGASVTWGPQQHGLRSRIWVEDTSFGLHDIIPIHYEIQNASKADQVIWHSGFWPNHRIEITGPSGQSVALTPLGEKTRKSFSPDGPREKNVPVSLKPGETDSAWPVFNLRDYFVMDTAGAYLVSYTYQERGVGVTSNRLRIELKVR